MCICRKFKGISLFRSDSLLRLCTGQWAMSRPLFYPDPLFVPKPHKKTSKVQSLWITLQAYLSTFISFQFSHLSVLPLFQGKNVLLIMIMYFCNTLVSWETLHPEESSFCSRFLITTLEKSCFITSCRFWHFLLIFLLWNPAQNCVLKAWIKPSNLGKSTKNPGIYSGI